jgi:hypothetical protein
MASAPQCARFSSPRHHRTDIFKTLEVACCRKLTGCVLKVRDLFLEKADIFLFVSVTTPALGPTQRPIP